MSARQGARGRPLAGQGDAAENRAVSVGEWAADLSAGARDDQTKDRRFVTALARGLAILRALEDGGGVLGNQQLARRTGLPKPTITRLTYTLTRLGYLTYSERLGKYQIGPAALSLGYTAVTNLRIRQIAQPHMQQLADVTSTSVGLGMRDRLEMVLIESCHGDAPISLRNHAGARLPLATTSMGRAFLAALPEDERRYFMERLRERYPTNWKTVEKGIRQAVEDHATKGYCVSIGDWLPNVFGVGVALELRDEPQLMALNSGGPAFHVDRRRLEEEVAPQLLMIARNIRGAAGP